MRRLSSPRVLPRPLPRPLAPSLLAPTLLLLLAACGDDSSGTGGGGGDGPGAGGSTSSPSSTSSGPTSSGPGTTSSSSGQGPGTGGAGGEGTGGGMGGAGGGSGGMGGAIDLDGGTYEIENVSQTPGTLSHDGRVARLPDGTTVIVWSEPDDVDIFDQDIVGRASEGGAFGPLEILTDDDAIQNAFPSIVADGAEVVAIWNGYPEGLNDLYGARRSSAGDWSARENLTGPLEGDGLPYADLDPVIAREPGPGGDLLASFLSYPVDAEGASLGPTVVRVLGGGNVASVIATEDGSDCTGATLAFDDDGSVVVVAACGFFGSSQLWMVRGTPGQGFTSPVALTDGGDDDRPVLALGPDGLHLGFQRFSGCEDGDVCVLHAMLEGDALEGPVEVDGAATGAYAPAIGVDPWGRVLMTFHAFDDGNYGDVFVVHADPGGAFSAPRNVTPGTPASDEWFPEAITFGADGAPWIVFEGIVPDSDPLDEEIYLAKLVP